MVGVFRERCPFDLHKQSLNVRLPEQRFQIIRVNCGTAGKHSRIRAFTLSMVLSLLSDGKPLPARTTMGRGSIVGSVSDPSGALISGVKVLAGNDIAGNGAGNGD
jgi:hypothetical protein